MEEGQDIIDSMGIPVPNLNDIELPHSLDMLIDPFQINFYKHYINSTMRQYSLSMEAYRLQMEAYMAEYISLLNHYKEIEDNYNK